MHPSEIEYMAENEIIQIVPNFNNASHMHLICGSFGPFRAGLPLRVPIWAALNLRQKKICRILPPDWMNVEKLNEKIEEEKASKYLLMFFIMTSTLIGIDSHVQYILFQILYTIAIKLLFRNYSNVVNHS